MRTLLFLVCLPLAVLAGPTADTVTVTGGRISGTATSDGAIRVFKGIPFAAPPVGDLRWKAPQPVTSWSGVRACTTFGPSPMQGVPAPFGPWSAEYLIAKEPISEDCLYLNVWTPQATGSTSSTQKLPVLVWIYGGGFNSGGNSVPIYDGEASARKGIVFISINYRVGAFGFLAHPELTKESGRATPGRTASGNYGLMDQLAALRWVQQNIATFGGDPANVTIAGQSAGSMSVNCLVASPLANGLFGKAIAQSGAMLTRPQLRLQQAEEIGIKAMQALGATSLTEMRAIPADEVLKKAQGMRGPIVDGYVLPQSVGELFAANRQNPVQLLTGWNEDEGMGGPPKPAADFRQQTEKQYGSGAASLWPYYPIGNDTEAARSQINLSRDVIFGAQNYAWATLNSERGQPTYVYRFKRKIPATGAYATYGAFHTGEVAYAYDNLRFIDRQLRPLETADTELARMMATYWANFIKTGNPNGTNLPNWPAFNPGLKQVMVFDTHVGASRMTDGAALDALLTVLKNQP